MDFQKRVGEIVFTGDGSLLEKHVVEVNDVVTLKTKTESVKVKVSNIKGEKYSGGLGGSGVGAGTTEDDSVCFFYDEIHICHKSKPE